jgi:hypothetical protein
VIKLQSISVLVLAAAVAGCFAAPVLAEEPPTPENISESVTRALFNQSGDIYRNRGIDRQATFLFGLSYPENEYTSDAAAVEKLYKAGMYQQGGSGKVIRTADLPNPFSSSIRTTPAQVKLTAKFRRRLPNQSKIQYVPPHLALDGKNWILSPLQTVC